MDPHFIVVIGASLGGVRALLRLLPALPADFPAPVLVVLHIGAYPSRMPALLESRGALEVVQARDGDVPERCRVYFAAPDHHMVLEAGARSPGGWVHENAVAVGAGEPMEHLQAIARPSTFVCPDCKGSLWEVDGTQPLRYRCHTGHGFSLRSLQQTQSEETEAALWTAIRALQEKELLARKRAE